MAAAVRPRWYHDQWPSLLIPFPDVGPRWCSPRWRRCSPAGDIQTSKRLEPKTYWCYTMSRTRQMMSKASHHGLKRREFHPCDTTAPRLIANTDEQFGWRWWPSLLDDSTKSLYMIRRSSSTTPHAQNNDRGAGPRRWLILLSSPSHVSRWLWCHTRR
jgi:hypothetical protein